MIPGESIGVSGPSSRSMADLEDPAEGVASNDPVDPGVAATDPAYPGVAAGPTYLGVAADPEDRADGVTSKDPDVAAADPAYLGVAADPIKAPYPEEPAAPMEPLEKGALELDGKTGWSPTGPSPTFLPFFGLGSPLGFRSFDILKIQIKGM